MKTFALLTGLTLSLTSLTQADLTIADLAKTTTNHSTVVSTSVAPTVGRVYGPADVNRRVEAYSSYTDYILFEGDERARVTINGDGDCDLDLYIYNPEGVLVAKDDDNTDYCVASWVPNYRKSYKIVVVNRGRVYANYNLSTN